jgi:NAD(P)H-dependent FMN reductase
MTPYCKKEYFVNIVAILGSPRPKGNSTTIAERFMESAGKYGAKTIRHNLVSMTYRGCVACMECKTRADKCVLRDDLTRALNDVAEADIVVMASPVYFGDVTGQFKCFIDRTFSYLVPDFLTNPKPTRLPEGKKLLFVLTQGFPDLNTYADVFPRYERFLRWEGFGEIELVRACGVSLPGEVAGRMELMERADCLAEKFCS